MWVINRKFHESFTFLDENALFCFKFSPQNTENRILGLWKFKIFWGSPPPETPPPPPKKGTNGPLLIQSVTLFKPAGYFNYYWNPCCLIFMTIDQWRQPTFPSFPWSGSKLFKNSSNTCRSVISPFLYLGFSLQL